MAGLELDWAPDSALLSVLTQILPSTRPMVA